MSDDHILNFLINTHHNVSNYVNCISVCNHCFHTINYFRQHFLELETYNIYLYRIPPCTETKIVHETCEAIHQFLKEKVLVDQFYDINEWKYSLAGDVLDQVKLRGQLEREG